MQRDVAQSPNVMVFRPPARAQNDDLVGLAEPVLEEVLRLRAGLDAPTHNLRRRIDDLLKGMEKRAATWRYSAEQVQAIKFALAAFVDETVLSVPSPVHADWEKYLLQHQYFGKAVAGNEFFERLEALLSRPEEERNAEAAEVYYLCLLLGFKGRYNILPEDELRDVIADTERRLREAGRLRDGALSPNWRRDDQPRPAGDPGLPRWAKIGGAVLVAATVLLFLVLKYLLEAGAADAQRQLLR